MKIPVPGSISSQRSNTSGPTLGHRPVCLTSKANARDSRISPDGVIRGRLESGVPARADRERRLAEAGVTPGDHRTAVVLAAAGSVDSSWQRHVRDLAASWRARGWWAVEPAFASAATPTVCQAVARLRDRGALRSAVASYLLFPGRFADRLTTAGADICAGPLAPAPEVVQLILRRNGLAAKSD